MKKSFKNKRDHEQWLMSMAGKQDGGDYVKYIKAFVEHFEKFPAFTVKDVKVFLSRYGISERYTHVLVHNLVSSGRINRMAKGVYTFKKDPTLANFAFFPSYHGLQDALSLHGFWEQETNPVLLTPRRVRPGVRRILGANVVIRRIDRRMFFGFESMKYYDFWIPVSDVEKTLIDFLYFKEPLSRDAAKEIRRRVRKELLKDYLRRVPPYLKERVEEFLRG